MSYPPQSPQSATIIPAHTVRHAATTLVVAAAAVAEDGNQNRQNVGHLHGTRPAAMGSRQPIQELRHARNLLAQSARAVSAERRKILTSVKS